MVWDEENEREIVLLTNHLEFGATTIAAIYKERWQIELFFKALKQNLKVKTFVGTSENALRIQIWTALIAMLLLKWLHHLSKAGWSLSNLAAMLRLNLFTYRDLIEWLNDPLGTPPWSPLRSNLLWRSHDLDRPRHPNRRPPPECSHTVLQIPCFQQTALQVCPVLDSSGCTCTACRRRRTPRNDGVPGFRLQRTDYWFL